MHHVAGHCQCQTVAVAEVPVQGHGRGTDSLGGPLHRQRQMRSVAEHGRDRLDDQLPVVSRRTPPSVSAGAGWNCAWIIYVRVSIINDWGAMENQLLAGKVALVTGASKNIGKGIALEVAACGASTYLTARTLEDDPSGAGSLRRTSQEIAAAGGIAHPLACDHTDDSQVERVFDAIEAAHGRLDLVVNVASPDFSSMVGRPFWELPFDDMSRCLEIGPRLIFVVSALAARMMARRGEGLIVNVSSHGSRD